MSDQFEIQNISAKNAKPLQYSVVKTYTQNALNESTGAKSIIVDMKDAVSKMTVPAKHRFRSQFTISGTSLVYTSNVCMKKTVLDFFTKITAYSQGTEFYSSPMNLDVYNNMTLEFFGAPSDGDNVLETLEGARSEFPHWVYMPNTSATGGCVYPATSSATGAELAILPIDGTSATTLVSPYTNLGFHKKIKSFQKYMDETNAKYVVRLDIPLVCLCPFMRDDSNFWNSPHLGLNLKYQFDLVDMSTNGYLMQCPTPATSLKLASHQSSLIAFDEVALSPSTNKSDLQKLFHPVKEKYSFHTFNYNCFAPASAKSSVATVTDILTNCRNVKRVIIWGTPSSAYQIASSPADAIGRLKDLQLFIKSSAGIFPNVLTEDDIRNYTRRCMPVVDSQTGLGVNAIRPDVWEKCAHWMVFDIEEEWDRQCKPNEVNNIRLTANRASGDSAVWLDWHAMVEEKVVHLVQPINGGKELEIKSL